MSKAATSFMMEDCFLETDQFQRLRKGFDDNNGITTLMYLLRWCMIYSAFVYSSCSFPFAEGIHFRELASVSIFDERVPRGFSIADGIVGHLAGNIKHTSMDTLAVKFKMYLRNIGFCDFVF